MKKLTLCVLLCVLCGGSFAQTVTAVSGTVADVNGVPYANGTITPQFVNVSGGATPTVTATGANYFPPTSPTTLSSTGTFSFGLLANGSITPNSTKYQFLICSGAGSVPVAGGSGSICFTTGQITISGATQSITSNINTASPPALTAIPTTPNLTATGVVKFGASTGLSSPATGVLAAGNATQGDVSGQLESTGYWGVEAPCTGAALGLDILCADSVLHAFKSSLNNGSFVAMPQLAGDLGNTAASPQVTATHLAAALPVAQGGTALASGTSGGVLGFTASGTIASSVALTANLLVKGGGVGATPTNSSITDDGTTVSTSETINGGALQQNATPVAKVICSNVTPVTVAANTTSDQNLQACTLPAGTLNTVGKILNVYTAGIYSTAANSTAQITLKVKICTVSGCGSGTVIAVCSIQSVALATVTVTNNTWTGQCVPITQTAGASAVFERSGILSIDLGSLTTAADSIFLDPAATAVTSAIDSTASLFVQVSGAYSAGSTSNSMSGRQLIVSTQN